MCDSEDNENSHLLEEFYGPTSTDTSFDISLNGSIAKASSQKSFKSITDAFKSVFLPEGYPVSVSEDYTQYQVWDTIQAFCSSICGALAATAVFETIGVGDMTATVYGATLTWLIKDGTGMIGKIVFVWYQGTLLDSNSKMWRLFADILNDCSFFVDLVSPYCPVAARIYVVSFAGLLRSIVGVAGGSTRASLTQHQAIQNNMADVSAKDNSQETLMNLMALIVNLILLNFVKDNKFLVWQLFILFVFGHIFANYKAVKSVIMNTFNQNRYHILIQHFLKTDSILNPIEVNRREPVFKTISRNCRLNFGCSLSDLKELSIGQMSQLLNDKYCLVVTKSKTKKIDLQTCIQLLNCIKSIKERHISIILHKNCKKKDLLKALYQFELIEFSLKNEKLGLSMLKKAINSDNFERIEIESHTLANLNFDLLIERCRIKNWSFDSIQFSQGPYRYDYAKQQ